MNPAKTKLDTMAYLLGGVGLLAISVIPVVTVAMSEVQLMAKLLMGGYWLIGVLLLWWAVRRFTALGERVVALIGVVIGWYIILQVLMILETMVFRF